MPGTPELEAQRSQAQPAPSPVAWPQESLLRQGDPVRVGVISGHGYRNLRGGLDRVKAYLQHVPSVPHRQVRDPAETRAALEEFAAAGIEVVAVNGGDGTVSMVATHLLRSGAGPRPLLAIIEGGRTNMTAGDVGIRGKQVRRLRHLLAWAESSDRRRPEIIRRTAIRVDPGDGEPVCGFFVGGAAVYHASLAAWKAQKAKRIPFMHTALGTASSVVRQVTAHIVSRSAWEPTTIRLEVDGEALPEDRWCVLFATTLRRMALGINPFWGQGEGDIRISVITHDHRKLFRSATAGLFGRTNRHLGPQNGYYSYRVDEVVCELDSCLTLDGEVVRPRDGVIRLSSGGSLDFLRI